MCLMAVTAQASACTSLYESASSIAASMQDAVQSITAAPNSGQGQSQARALAASWCVRLLDEDNSAEVPATTASSAEALAEDAVVAEAEVAEAAVVSGDDVSHFRNLLRRARSAKQAAAAAALNHEAEGARGQGPQKLLAAKKSAKRARAGLTKWLIGVAESTVLV